MGKTAGRKKRIVITTAAMLAIGGGAAFAYWTSTATTDKTVQSTADSTAITISVGAFSAASSPGGPAQTATFTVANPGSGVQRVSSVAATILNADGTAWAAGTCSKDDFEVSTAVVPTELSAAQSVTGTVTLKMINRVDVNQNDCKGVAVPLHFLAS